MQTKKIEFGDGFGIFPEKSEQNENAGIYSHKHFSVDRKQGIL
jgi:hypothetical protein